MAESSPFEAVVNQILEGRAAPQVRQAAARGALPLPRATLVRLFIALREDEDEQIRADAQASLGGLDSPALCDVFDDAACTSEVLDFFAERAIKDENLAERIAFHREASAAAVTTLAAGGNSKVIDLILTNQERLLAHPSILDSLSVNPALRADQRGRIIELLDRATRRGPEDAGGDEEEVTDEVREAARLLEVDVGELFAASEIIDGEEFEQAEDPGIRSAYRRILTLSPARKAVLALRGGREERMILVRDSNKLVSLSVLRNGRITEDDIDSIARMRNVSQEVLRAIGQNRDWTKSYSVALALVNNPRTPPGTSTNFIARMHNKDLKRMGTNHDVPELIRRMCKRTLDMRRPKNILKKK